MKYGIYYAYWERQWGADYLKYIKKVGKLGFDILEISCAGVKDLGEEEADRLRACAEEEGVLLTGGYGPKPSEDLFFRRPGGGEERVSVLEGYLPGAGTAWRPSGGRRSVCLLAGGLFQSAG